MSPCKGILAEKKLLATLPNIGHDGRKMDVKIAELKAGVDLSRTWMHVDMDAFYAACEELDDPSLVRRLWHLLG